MNQEEYYIGQIFKGKYPVGAAIWCNKNNAQIIKVDEYTYQIIPIPEPAIPTKEEQVANRAAAYQNEVDPITSHISRLRDKKQTAEIKEEINLLIAERDAKVEEIKERYPYPTDPIYEEQEEVEEAIVEDSKSEEIKE